MIVLDTNVISEVMRPAPDRAVVRWVRDIGAEGVITAITVAEILAGLAALPPENRRRELTDAVEGVLARFRGTDSILPFDGEAARCYAVIHRTRAEHGRPISTADAQIAAICMARRAVCATRNVRDFEETGIELVNPWAAQ